MQEPDYEEIAKEAKEIASRKSNQMYPPDMPEKRQQQFELEYVKAYRELAGICLREYGSDGR